MVGYSVSNLISFTHPSSPGTTRTWDRRTFCSIANISSHYRYIYLSQHYSSRQAFKKDGKDTQLLFGQIPGQDRRNGLGFGEREDREDGEALG